MFLFLKTFRSKYILLLYNKLVISVATFFSKLFFLIKIIRKWCFIAFLNWYKYTIPIVHEHYKRTMPRIYERISIALFIIQIKLFRCRSSWFKYFLQSNDYKHVKIKNGNPLEKKNKHWYRTHKVWSPPYTSQPVDSDYSVGLPQMATNYKQPPDCPRIFVACNTMCFLRGLIRTDVNGWFSQMVARKQSLIFSGLVTWFRPFHLTTNVSDSSPRLLLPTNPLILVVEKGDNWVWTIWVLQVTSLSPLHS